MKRNQLFFINQTSFKAVALICLSSFFGCSKDQTSISEESTAAKNSQAQVSAAQQVWYANPDQPWQNSFDNFNIEDNGGTNPTVTTLTDATYGKVWRVYKPSGAKRAELSRASSYNQQEGETIDLNYKWKINPEQNLGSSEISVFQWKSEDGSTLSRQNYPFNLTYDNGNLKLNTYGPGTPDYTQGSSIENRKNTIWSKAVNQGTWVSIGFRIKVSKYIGSDLTKIGYIEFYFNGTKQVFTTQNSTSQYDIILSGDKKRAYHRTNDGVVTYPKWGVYNEESRPFDIRVLLADMTITRL